MSNVNFVQVVPSWDDIKAAPRVIDKVHQSVFRSSYVLEEVKSMLDRKDSQETILKFIYMMEDKPDFTVTTTSNDD